nr:hypothetical protein [Fodinicola acaciae]
MRIFMLVGSPKDPVGERVGADLVHGTWVVGRFLVVCDVVDELVDRLGLLGRQRGAEPGHVVVGVFFLDAALLVLVVAALLGAFRVKGGDGALGGVAEPAVGPVLGLRDDGCSRLGRRCWGR